MTLRFRYTGYMQGMSETFKKTPMMAQLETKAPTEESFIHTRTASPPKLQPARDPCNFPDSFKVGLVYGDRDAEKKTKSGQDPPSAG